MASIPAVSLAPHVVSPRQIRLDRGEVIRRFVALHDTADAAERDEQRDQLIIEHDWIARRAAGSFSGRGEPYDDLYQVASMALVKAVDRFDPEAGSAFPSFATPTVKGELRRHFRDHTWRMSVSRRVKDLGPRLNTASEELTQQLGHSPSPHELAAYLDIAVDDVLETLDCRAAYRPQSIDAPLGSASDGATLEDRLAISDPELVTTAGRLTLLDAVSQLDERRQRILVATFYEGSTQSEIGVELGIGQVQVSRLLRSGLAELHDLLDIDLEIADRD